MPFDRRKVGIPVCVGLDIGHLIELQTTNCPFFKGDCFCFFRLTQEQVEFIRFSVFFCFAFRITLGFRAVERFANRGSIYFLSQRNFIFITFFRGQCYPPPFVRIGRRYNRPLLDSRLNSCIGVPQKERLRRNFVCAFIIRFVG